MDKPAWNYPRSGTQSKKSSVRFNHALFQNLPWFTMLHPYDWDPDSLQWERKKTWEAHTTNTQLGSSKEEPAAPSLPLEKLIELQSTSGKFPIPGSARRSACGKGGEVPASCDGAWNRIRARSEKCMSGSKWGCHYMLRIWSAYDNSW